MPQFVPLSLDWATHQKLDTTSLEQSVHGKDEAPEGCTCDLCTSDENIHDGWRQFATLTPDLSCREWLDEVIPEPWSNMNPVCDSKTNKTLSLTIDYTGDNPTDMTRIIQQVSRYSSWTGNLEVIIHSGLSRNKNQHIKHVQEIKALVQQINMSLAKIHTIRCRFIVDRFNFVQLKLAAGFIGLKSEEWTLAYVDESDKNEINDIHKKSAVYKKLEAVYWKDFAEKLEVYEDE